MLGVDPRPFTLRQLAWMDEGRGMDAWKRTGEIWALLANVHRDPKRAPRPFTGMEINPYAHLCARPVEDRGMSVADSRMEELFRSMGNGERRGH